MFTDRQQKIIQCFLEDPLQLMGVNRLPDFGVDRTTLFRDLKVLTDSEFLVSESTSKGRVYALNKNSDAYLEWDLSRPPSQRASVAYNPKLLNDYLPNKTFLLSSQQLNSLKLVCDVSNEKSVVDSTKNYGRVLSSLLIDLTYASSNLENVKISWLDTKTLIEFGEVPGGLSDKQVKVVLNHKAAINYMAENRHELSFTNRTLMDLHSLLIDNLLGDRSAIGALRKRVVIFDDSKYLPPDNPHLLREIFSEFCEKVNEIKNPYEQAFFAMTFVPYIQPFEDGNKRTSRISMNIPLIANELPPFSFTDMKKRDYMFGLLAFYERGNHQFLAKTFVSAYERSASRYTELLEFVEQGGLLNTITEKYQFTKEGFYSGKVLDVADGVMIQKIDREGNIERHDVTRLSAAVKVGDVVDIKYRDGLGEVSEKTKFPGIKR